MESWCYIAAIVAVLTALAMLTAETECIQPIVWLGVTQIIMGIYS